MRCRLALLALSLSVAGCTGPSPRTQPDDNAQPTLQLIHSPNGEPLGRAICRDALVVWFGHADTNHDGGISADEFSADSALQFTRLDRDGDVVITADELQDVRRPFLTEQQNPEQPQPPEGNSRSSIGRGEDPVMTADTNLDFKVSRIEFQSRAGEVFARLDHDRDHRLTREEVTAPCPAAPPPR